MKAIKTYSDIVGYVGTALILGLYLLLATATITLPQYLALSLVSSALMTIHAVERRSRPVVFLNAAWFVISIVGLIRAGL